MQWNIELQMVLNALATHPSNFILEYRIVLMPFSIHAYSTTFRESSASMYDRKQERTLASVVHHADNDWRDL